ncbi:MAG: hypothetical protein HRT36_04980 [Alphaproteobacteria bacterium]|nr:hypothetical protein [Alphaproteobacteria bacterium]
MPAPWTELMVCGRSCQRPGCSFSLMSPTKGLSGQAFAQDLPEPGVAIMPGDSFGVHGKDAGTIADPK